MGYGNFSVSQYQEQAEQAKNTHNSGFTQTSIYNEFNPLEVDLRQSKKGPFNDYRDPITILVGLDVTGSMGSIPKQLLTGKLGDLIVTLKKTYSRPNENLQISFAGIGDAKHDRAPLQVTHFESDNRFAQQLPKIWLEGGGGVVGEESYNILWWYAAHKTHLNYVNQDHRKGILFTMGDEDVYDDLTASEIRQWLDPKYDGGSISNAVMLKNVREQYEVYHIMITDGSAYKHQRLKRWQSILGEEYVIQAKSDGVAEAIAKVVAKYRPIQKQELQHLSDEQWVEHTRKNLSTSQWVEVLSYTMCPLTKEFMKFPVVWGDNKRAYEKDAVRKYIDQNKKDPITGQTVRPQDIVLKNNANIAQLCLNYEKFFNELPEQRRKELVELTFPSQEQQQSKAPNQNQNLNQNPNQGAFKPVFQQEPPRGNIVIESSSKLQSQLECPITQEIMTDPVILKETGQTYERNALVEWLKNHDTDPLTNQKLSDKGFVANNMVKSLCEQYRQDHPEQSRGPKN